MRRPPRNRSRLAVEHLEDRNLLTGGIGGLPGVLAVAAGDLNGDRCADLAVVRHNGGGGGGGGSGGVVYLEAWTGDGKGGLTLASSVAVPNLDRKSISIIFLGDADGDRDRDVALASPAGGRDVQITVLANDGKGTFSPETRKTFVLPHVLERDGRVHGDPHVDLSGGKLAVVDVNRDGALDLVLATVEGQGDVLVSVVYGDGKGGFGGETRKTFVLPHVFETKNGGNLVDIGDLDGDGAPDLIAQRGSEVVYVSVDGGASPRVNKIEALTVKQGVGRVLTGDVDGDGDLDLVTVDGGAVTLARNVGDLDGDGDIDFVTSVVPGAPYRGDPDALFLGDLDGDGAPDLIAVLKTKHDIAMNAIRNMKA